MSSRQELVDNDPELNFRKHELFEQRYITNKHGILHRIDQVIQTYKGQIERQNNSNTDVAYIATKIQYLLQFKEKVSTATLPDGIGEWWSYSFTLGAQGIILYLNHFEGADIDGEEGNEYLNMRDQDAEFPLITIRAKLLSAEEFASLHHVASPTIRVWIRRGKIRSAIKVGNTWKIPELASFGSRKNEIALYKWELPLEGIPDSLPMEFQYPGMVSITQCKKNKQLYDILHSINDDENPRVHILTITSKEAEKLEAFLISQQSVIYVGDTESYD